MTQEDPETDRILALMAELTESAGASFGGLTTSDGRTWLEVEQAPPEVWGALRAAFPDLPLVQVPAEVLRRHGELRLGVLRARESALRRSAEVHEAVATAIDPAAAHRAIRQLLGLDETQAWAVLHLPWQDATVSRREELTREIAAQVAAPDPAHGPEGA